MRKFGLAIAAAAVLGLFAGTAWAAPADKVAVGANTLLVFECDSSNGVLGTIPCVDTGTKTGDIGDPGLQVGAVVIPAILYKSSTSGDLVFHFATECSLFTETRAKRNTGVGGAEIAQADAGVKMWIELDDDALPLDPLAGGTGGHQDAETGAAPFVVAVSPNAGDNGEVTMCRRIQELAVDIGAAELTDEEVRLTISTLTANAFNWVSQNPAAIAGADPAWLLNDNQYYIRVMARIELESSGDAISGAGFAKRLLIIDSVHLATGTSF